MDDHISRDGDGEGASLHGHDARSILSASTSSRVTLTGPRQRPKGPRTSDVSRSSIPERPTLPLSPLAKEILTVSEESSCRAVASSTSNHNANHNPNTSSNTNHNHNSSNKSTTLASTSQPPRRTSFVARLSFRRSPSRSQHEPERVFADDPFRATPHPSVRWETASFHEPLLVDDQNVKLSTHAKDRLSLTPEISPKNLVSLKPKRSFFRRMADKLMRTHYTPRSEPDFPKTQFASVKDHYRADSPITYFPSKLPMPSSPTSLPGSPLPIVAHLDNSLSSLTSPDTIAVRTLPVLSTDGSTISSSVTAGESPLTPRFSGPIESLYHVHSVSPVTPASPSRNNHASVNSSIRIPMRSLHTPSSFSPPPTSGDTFNYYSSRKAMSTRSIPIMRDHSISEKRGKAMSIRSQQIEPSTGFKPSARTSREGGNTLVDLDKAMFEQELARERESEVSKEDKSPLMRKSASYTARVESTTPSMKWEYKRQPNARLMNRGNFHSFKPLPQKPSSAPNPSSSAQQRGLSFSVNLDTSSEVNIPSSPVSLAHFSRRESDRLYPDVLYTVNQSHGSLLPLSGSNRSTRSLVAQRSPRSLPEPTDERSSQAHSQNGHDKVSRWLASTSRPDDLADPTYPLSSEKGHLSNTELDELTDGIVFKHRDKGKGRAF